MVAVPSSVRAFRSRHQETPFARSYVDVLVPGLIPTTELLGASKSALSVAYKCQQISSCFTLFKQLVVQAWSLALESDGNNSAARIAIMAITTKSSISVKA